MPWIKKQHTSLCDLHIIKKSDAKSVGHISYFYPRSKNCDVVCIRLEKLKFWWKFIWIWSGIRKYQKTAKATYSRNMTGTVWKNEGIFDRHSESTLRYNYLVTFIVGVVSNLPAFKYRYIHIYNRDRITK